VERYFVIKSHQKIIIYSQHLTMNLFRLTSQVLRSDDVGERRVVFALSALEGIPQRCGGLHLMQKFIVILSNFILF